MVPNGNLFTLTRTSGLPFSMDQVTHSRHIAGPDGTWTAIGVPFGGGNLIQSGTINSSSGNPQVHVFDPADGWDNVVAVEFSSFADQTFDDFIVTPVPEPSALVLLGLGGASWYWIRRARRRV